MSAAQLRTNVTTEPVTISTALKVHDRATRFVKCTNFRLDNTSVVRDTTGHINTTYRITRPADTTGGYKDAIVQQISPIFAAGAIDNNLQLFMGAQDDAKTAEVVPDSWIYADFSRVVYDRSLIHYEQNGSVTEPWRVMETFPGELFIFEKFANVPEEYKEQAALSLGKAIAIMGKILSYMPVAQVQSPLPNFHDPLYHYDYLQRILAGETVVLSLSQDTSKKVHLSDEMMRKYPAEIQKMRDMIEARKDLLTILQDCGTAVTHGDFKITNGAFKMIKQLTCVGFFDLDTIQLGSRLDDLGDGLRSAGNPAGEDPDKLDDINIDKVIVDAMIHGCLEQMGPYYDSSVVQMLEQKAIPSFAHYLYVQGIRFFADALIGNVYWKPKGQRGDFTNLWRSMAQMDATMKALKAYKL